MYSKDQRIVLTLDAGGTNFVFSAIQSNEQIVEPICRESCADNLEDCLMTLVDGFNEVLAKLPSPPVAISFAFPGPADYPKGIIGDLPNFPAFKGGVALGPFLEQRFGIPVYINNDGDLFAYGEAIAGTLRQVNHRLAEAGSQRRFRNLIGVTLGTGFGAGVVVGGELLIGDNSDGGNVWCCRNMKYPQMIIEESVSIRAIKRVYGELSGSSANLTPKDIFDIACGEKQGDMTSAILSFEELGEMAAEAISNTQNIVDGLIVIGGGLCGAERFIIPAIVRGMNSRVATFSGDDFPRTSVRVVDLSRDFKALTSTEIRKIRVPLSDTYVEYCPEKISGIALSTLGTSRAICLGAYAFALTKLNSNSR